MNVFEGSVYSLKGSVREKWQGGIGCNDFGFASNFTSISCINIERKWFKTSERVESIEIHGVA